MDAIDSASRDCGVCEAPPVLILKVSRRDFARRNIAARLIYCPWRGLGPPEYQPRLPVSARSHSSPHSHADQQPSRRDPSARFNSAAPSAFLPNPHSRPSSSLDRPGKDVAFYKHTGGGVMTAYEVGLLSSKDILSHIKTVERDSELDSKKMEVSCCCRPISSTRSWVLRHCSTSKANYA